MTLVLSTKWWRPVAKCPRWLLRTPNNPCHGTRPPDHDVQLLRQEPLGGEEAHCGSRRVRICDACVGVCQNVLAKEFKDDSPAGGPAADRSEAGGIEAAARPSSGGAGQDEADAQRRRVQPLQADPQPARARGFRGGGTPEEQRAPHYPTGCGKTLAAQTIARLIDVPFAIADATSLTEPVMWVRMETIILRLLQNADYDVKRAQMGIVYVDEIDKLARKPRTSPSPATSAGKASNRAPEAPGGHGVQRTAAGRRKHPQQEYIRIGDQHSLHLRGAFVGLDKVVQRRLGRRIIGFSAGKAGIDAAHAPRSEVLLKRVEPGICSRLASSRNSSAGFPP